MTVNYETKIKERKLEECLKKLKDFFYSEVSSELKKRVFYESKKRKRKFGFGKHKKSLDLFRKEDAITESSFKKRRAVKSQPPAQREIKISRLKDRGAPLKEKPEKRIVCVAIIVRRLTVPYKFVILKDYDKNGFKFTGGKPQEKDENFKKTAQRETKEEIDFFAKSEKFFFVGEFEIPDCNSNSFVYFQVYAVDIPKNKILNPGENQEAVYEVYPYDIEEFIEHGIFLKNHAKAWKLYKIYIEK